MPAPDPRPDRRLPTLCGVNSGSSPHAAVLLIGPTASGKTRVAHRLAEQLSLPLLSADSMLVYRDMDIGTAKPSPEERIRFHYAGLDLTGSENDFSTGSYLEAVQEQMSGTPSRNWLVCGGTGLYVSALVRGLNQPTGDPGVRQEAETRFAEGGTEALRVWLGQIDPDALRVLADPSNPRRLIRAIEQALAAPVRPAPELRPAEPFPAVGLLVPPEQLARRIQERTRRMIRDGWIEEVRALRNRPTPLSKTAAMAIGYRELSAVLDGLLPLDTALDRIRIRTRQYAKRQMTWFRNQIAATWIDAGDERTPEAIASQIEIHCASQKPLPLTGLTDRGKSP